MRILCFLEAALALMPALAFAQVPENQEARERYHELVLGPLYEAASAPAAVIPQSQGPRVRFRTEAGDAALYYLFLNETGSSFPVAGAGNWVVKRSKQDGRFLQAKVFFRNDPGCFLRLFPDGALTRMDVFLFDLQVYGKVPIPLAFSELLRQPFERIRRLSESFVQWQTLLYRGSPEADRYTEQVAARIHAELPNLREARDGAMDAQGRYVRIEDLQPQGGAGGLNCSGFAKWVVDGFIRPLTGSYADIGELKRRHPQLRGNRWSQAVEESRDPYFGLDWSRNLAAALMRAAGQSESGLEECDVRKVPYLNYREDVGFSMEELAPALFLDRQEHPDGIYIGSLNRVFDGQPPLRQHYHLVVFLPYFTASGDFRVAVFDTGRETGLEALRRRFAGHFVHLVRLEGGLPFEAPKARS